MLAKLVGLDATAPTPEVVISELPSVIGRSSEADVCIKDAWASRVHCAIDRDRQVLVVRDLDSRNGTFVNGRRIEVAQLRPGDRLTVGVSTFAVDYDRGLFSADATSGATALRHG